MKAILISGGILVALTGLGWTSLRVQPAPFPARFRITILPGRATATILKRPSSSGR